jgi:hypothetical protein
VRGNQQTLSLDRGEEEEDLFSQKVTEWTEMQLSQEEYKAVEVDEMTLLSIPFEDVFVVDYTKVCPTMPKTYYKLMIPDLGLAECAGCSRLFLRDEYEFAYLQGGCCPFCRHRETN